MSEVNFKLKLLDGFKWSFGRQFVVQLFNVVLIIFLSRWLSPTDFGLIGMVTVFTGFAIVLQDFGIGSALIHFDNLNETERSSAFWMSMLLNISFALLLCTSAQYIARFYQIPALKFITYWIALDFFLGASTTFPRSLLKKDLRFKELFFIDATALVLSGGIALFIAYHGGGVYSLIARSVVASFLAMLLFWWRAAWYPSLVFAFTSLQQTFRYTLPLAGESSLNYWVRNLDNLLIGKYLGEDSLGNYSNAYKLMLFPVRQVAGVFSQVMFPALSSIKSDKEQVKAYFLKMTRAVAFLTFPLMFGLFVLAGPFVLFLLGQQWEGVVPILRILSILGAIQSIGTLQGSVFLSQGATALQFKLGLFSKVFMLTAIVIALQWGVIGVAAAYTVSSAMMALPELYFMGSIIQLKVWSIIATLTPTFVSSASMAVCVAVIDFYLIDTGTSNAIRCNIGLIVGLATYLTINHFFKIRAYLEIRAVIKAMLT